LRSKEVDLAFAFPGEQADPWICAVESIGARVVCAASETAAGYMANGLAQAARSPSVVIVGGGPGLAMLAPAIQTAVVEGLPVLALVGQSDGSGFPETGESGTRDGALLGALFADAVVHASDFATVADALTSADHYLAQSRPVAVTVPVPGFVWQGPEDTSSVMLPRVPLTSPKPRQSTGVLSYPDVLRAALAAADGQAALFIDSGQARRTARVELPDGSFFDAPRTAPMGSALCGAIGTAIAQKGRTVAVVGDGSALMFVAELATAARHQAPVTIVVCVNGVLGGPHFRTSRLGSQSSILSAVDWPGIAAAFGVAWSEAGSPTELFAELKVPAAGPRLVLVSTPQS
jgi:thiamine pyrophosphate-dependent acetolactate synthase large subunit-like protein